MNSATFGITLSKLIESKLYEFQHHVEQNPKNILFFGVFAMESKNKYFILDNWQKKKKKNHITITMELLCIRLLPMISYEYHKWYAMCLTAAQIHGR